MKKHLCFLVALGTIAYAVISCNSPLPTNQSGEVSSTGQPTRETDAMTPPRLAKPGDGVVQIHLPVTGFGVSVAVDCDGNVYYTNNNQHNLYVMDKTGALLNTLPTVDSATGAQLNFDEMAWDGKRGVLWAQQHNSNPIAVYQIDPTTGVATLAWNSSTHSLGTFRDGIAYDGTDDTIWLSGDVSNTIDHYQADGSFIGQITPKNAGGGTLGEISGILVGVGDLMYLGRDGLRQIVQVKKSDGTFISSFASPGGTRDEGLECDPVNFAPKLVIWSRDTNNFMSVIEVETGTCACAEPNHPPQADAGPDQTLFVGDTVQLDGSGSSDPDSDPLTFLWTITSTPAGSSATLSDATAENPTFVPDLPGAYDIQLVVNDGQADSAPDQVVITAQTPQQAAQDVIDEIDNLGLNDGMANSMASKLEAAIDSLDRGNSTSAPNQLEALINQIEAQRGKALTDEQADALIASIQAILAHI